MSGSQFKERVVIPLVVILGTVAGLGFLGMQLLGFSGASSSQAEPAPVSSVSPATVAPTESIEPIPLESIDPATVKRPTVIVLNGTDKVGYAKKIGDNLNFEDWVIESVGNWDGEVPTENTVYYPEGNQAAAQLLAASPTVNGVIAQADATFSQTSLTIVLAK
jgi:hypothetical protein